MQNIAALGGHVLSQRALTCPVCQSQVHDKAFPQEADLTDRDGDVPARQLGLHRPLAAAVHKQRPADVRNDIKAELTALRAQRAQLFRTVDLATARAMALCFQGLELPNRQGRQALLLCF